MHFSSAGFRAASALRRLSLPVPTALAFNYQHRCCVQVACANLHSGQGHGATVAGSSMEVGGATDSLIAHHQQLPNVKPPPRCWQAGQTQHFAAVPLNVGQRKAIESCDDANAISRRGI